MELDFAFLADSAEVVGGKLYVLGGAVDTIWAQNVPITLPRVTLAMRFLSTPAEAGRKHAIEIVVLNEDGKKLAFLNGDLSIERPANAQPGLKQPSCFALNFFNLKFETLGSYSIEILMNGHSLKSIPLRVQQNPPAAVAH